MSNGTKPRTFEIGDAHRAQVPLLVGLFGASSSGKTCSALRLATGIQRVRGGLIVVIDTEARRALHYAPKSGEQAAPPVTFSFKHMAFGSPFGPLDYLSACESAAAAGAGVIVIDSASHLHEGPGGVLEQHAANVKRMAGDDWKKAERVNMAAWIQPKQDFRRFVNSILQMNIAIVMCFRAKKKIKPVKGEQPQEQGWMPIINEELPYEMTINALLEPGCDGIPNWEPNQTASREMVKLPQQFRERFLNKDTALDESDGEYLARWAAGDSVASAAPQQQQNGNGNKAPVFRGIADEDWRGKPLAGAPVSVLRDYWTRVSEALEKARNDRERDGIQRHLDAVKNELDAAEADAALDGAAE